MQSKPENWPASSAVETIPEVFLKIEDSSWPPASEGVEAGCVAVGEWSLDRSLTGGNLPGQVRGPSGFSIATAAVSFPQPKGHPLTPWARGNLNVSPGGNCELYASHDGPNGNGIPLGRFVIAPINGANVSNTVDLELEEASIRLQRPFTRTWRFNPDDPELDTSEILRSIAADAGFTETEIDDSGIRITAATNLPEASMWEVAQQIAQATLGAVWISEQGVFTYKNRTYLRGMVEPIATVEALDSIESLNWTIDPAEITDRVSMDFQPTDVIQSADRSTIWAATSKIAVQAGKTILVKADIEGTTDRVSPFVPLWKTDEFVQERMSRWAASYNENGGGERPPDNSLSISAKLETSSRIVIRITNRHDQPLWLVDGNGNPTLIVRTSMYVQQGEVESVASGRPEKSAMNPLSLNSGPWVQDRDDAAEMVAWAAAQTSQAQATINQVRVAPDLCRQLGDVILLTDDATNLRSKAIITGVHLSGDYQGYQQQLDLALLATLVDDFDKWSSRVGINTFTDLDNWFAQEGFASFSDFDEWLTDLGGQL